MFMPFDERLKALLAGCFTPRTGTTATDLRWQWLAPRRVFKEGQLRFDRDWPQSGESPAVSRTVLNTAEVPLMRQSPTLAALRSQTLKALRVSPKGQLHYDRDWPERGEDVLATCIEFTKLSLQSGRILDKMAPRMVQSNTHAAPKSIYSKEVQPEAHRPADPTSHAPLVTDTKGAKGPAVYRHVLDTAEVPYLSQSPTAIALRKKTLEALRASRKGQLHYDRDWPKSGEDVLATCIEFTKLSLQSGRIVDKKALRMVQSNTHAAPKSIYSKEVPPEVHRPADPTSHAPLVTDTKGAKGPAVYRRALDTAEVPYLSQSPTAIALRKKTLEALRASRKGQLHYYRDWPKSGEDVLATCIEFTKLSLQSGRIVDKKALRMVQSNTHAAPKSIYSKEVPPEVHRPADPTSHAPLVTDTKGAKSTAASRPRIDTAELPFLQQAPTSAERKASFLQYENDRQIRVKQRLRQRQQLLEKTTRVASAKAFEKLKQFDEEMAVKHHHEYQHMLEQQEQSSKEAQRRLENLKEEHRQQAEILNLTMHNAKLQREQREEQERRKQQERRARCKRLYSNRIEVITPSEPMVPVKRLKLFLEVNSKEAQKRLENLKEEHRQQAEILNLTMHNAKLQREQREEQERRKQQERRAKCKRLYSDRIEVITPSESMVPVKRLKLFLECLQHKDIPMPEGFLQSTFWRS